MNEVAESVRETLEHPPESRLNSFVAVMVAITATSVALCNVKDGNVVQAMAKAQTESVDAWSFYQSKSTKQHLAEGMAEQLILQRDTTVGLTPDGRTLFDKRIADLQANAQRYGKEKDEIKKKAEGLAKEYDHLNVKDDQFDSAEASLSVSIALFGVTALTQKKWLFVVALVFAGFGGVIGLAGFLGWNLHPEWLAKLLG